MFRLIIIYILCFVIYSCSSNIEQEILRMQGTRIDLSICKITPEINWSAYKNKIVFYIDSSGCTTCKLKLDRWKDFISDIEKISNSTHVILVFDGISEDKITQIKTLYAWKYLIINDKHGILNKKYKFPSDERINCFLLNEKNEIELIGNPTASDAVYSLYLKHILRLD